MKTNPDRCCHAISEGSGVLDAVQGKDAKILDAVIIGIECYFPSRNESCITVLYETQKGKWRLVFSQIHRFGFFYEDDISQVICERYKFFRHDEGFYVSLDPFEISGHEAEINENDNNFVLANAVQLFSEEPNAVLNLTPGTSPGAG